MSGYSSIGNSKHSNKIILKIAENSEVELPYKQVMAFLRIAHTMYILPTALKDIFKFFLKSRNLK